VVTETMKSPMGEVLDIATLDKGTLVMRKRTVKTGPVTVEMAFKDNKVTGSMATGTEPKPISADLGGEVFPDGAGSQDVLARLALAEGFNATYRNFDVQKQKVALKQVKVLGSEEVKVAAGTFKAWKLEVSSAEGDPGTVTIWVAMDSRKVVKSVTTLPRWEAR